MEIQLWHISIGLGLLGFCIGLKGVMSCIKAVVLLWEHVDRIVLIQEKNIQNIYLNSIKVEDVLGGIDNKYIKKINSLEKGIEKIFIQKLKIKRKIGIYSEEIRGNFVKILVVVIAQLKSLFKR